MKPIKELTQVATEGPQLATHYSPKPALPEKTIARFFTKMQAMYLTTWSSNFPTEDSLNVAMSIWAESLADLHINQIGKGLKACESRSGFPPTLGEFKRLAIGLPSRNQAIARVVAENACDPLTLEIMRTMGSYERRAMPTDQLERKAGRVYDDLFPGVLAAESGKESPWKPELQIANNPTSADSGVTEEGQAKCRAEWKSLMEQR